MPIVFGWDNVRIVGRGEVDARTAGAARLPRTAGATMLMLSAVEERLAVAGLAFDRATESGRKRRSDRRLRNGAAA
jgi:hypothetical protein